MFKSKDSILLCNEINKLKRYDYGKTNIDINSGAVGSPKSFKESR